MGVLASTGDNVAGRASPWAMVSAYTSILDKSEVGAALCHTWGACSVLRGTWVAMRKCVMHVIAFLPSVLILLTIGFNAFIQYIRRRWCGGTHLAR